MDQQEQHNSGQASAFERKDFLLAGALIAAALIFLAAASKVAIGNVDYICTRIIEENGECSDGAWSGWQTVSTERDQNACRLTTIERRVYTGTRTTRHLLQYVSTRTTCDAGYSQTDIGEQGSGASGFRRGGVVTETSACQIEQTRVHTSAITDGACASARPMTPTTLIETSQQDVGEAGQTRADVSSMQQLNALRATFISADIDAIPSLVRRGATTQVRWQGREVTACTIVGTNGDAWTGIAGEETSSAIMEPTVYTLSCTAFNGANVGDSASVDIVPEWQED